MSEGIPTRWLGRLSFSQASLLQNEHKKGILAGVAQEEIWLLEHSPVITRGRREIADLPDPNNLSEQGIELHITDRGGLATYHGPGQLIAWPHLDLRARNLPIRLFVESLEEAMISYLGTQSIAAQRRLGAPGVWIGKNKIGAVGVNASQGITTHGLSLNISTDLAPYRLFTPCGIVDGGVTSLHLCGAPPPTLESAATQLGSILQTILSTFSRSPRGAP